MWTLKKGEPWRNLQFNPVKLRLVQINFIVPNCYFRIGYMLSLNQYSATTTTTDFKTQCWRGGGVDHYTD